MVAFLHTDFKVVVFNLEPWVFPLSEQMFVFYPDSKLLLTTISSHNKTVFMQDFMQTKLTQRVIAVSSHFVRAIHKAGWICLIYNPSLWFQTETTQWAKSEMQCYVKQKIFSVGK